MLQDTFSITGGPNQTILDWYTGDDRIFTGVVAGLTAADPNLTDAYFTLKLNPNDPDADSILQKHITTALTVDGQITPPASLLINIYSGDYEGLVQPSTVYSWDFRVITTAGRTITVANGVVSFNQQVTQTNKAGTPAAIPNFAQPRFRGFAAQNPGGLTGTGNSNVGDIFFNSIPTSGGPTGWQCYAQGNPGTWRVF